jgi:dTMP kinase
MLITLEGIDGSGKTSHVDYIAKHLESLGRDVIKTKEPGATLIGNLIRSILLDPRLSENMDPMCELLLYCADRVQHCNEIIWPAFKSGKTIVCDRFTDSTLAYQGALSQIDIDNIRYVMDESDILPIDPHLTILFDLDPDIAIERIKKSRKSGERIIEDRFDSKNADFLNKVRKVYLGLARKRPERIKKIDASKSTNEIKEQIAPILDEAVAEYNEELH